MEIPAPETIFERFRLPIIIGLLGIILVGAGVLVFLSSSGSQDKIEIISSEETNPKTIFVDIEGAVEKPGVYELDFGSRVEDLLIVAGGLSAEANRDWMEKSLNRAQKLSDGTKIYIPLKSEGGSWVMGEGISSGGEVITGKININTASASELEALWGIGKVRAKAIIDNRPYQSVEELKTKKIIPSNVYERIKEEITVY